MSKVLKVYYHTKNKRSENKTRYTGQIHFLGLSNLAKQHQVRSYGQNKPKKTHHRVSGGQCSSIYAAIPNTTNPPENCPKICTAKSTPYKEQPKASTKQSGCKQSPPWCPSISSLVEKVPFDLKCHSVKAILA